MTQDYGFENQGFIKNSVDYANDPHPYAVRVPAPAKFFTTTTTTTTTTTEAPTTTTETSTQPQSSSSTDTEVDPYELYLDTRTSEFAASHPYAVRALPPNFVPSGIKHSADFEPMMSESNQSEMVVDQRESLPFIQILPAKTSNPWLVRSRYP